MTTKDDIPALLDALERHYAESVDRLRTALNAYAKDGTRPTRDARDGGAFSYPELRVRYDAESVSPTPARAFARLNAPGTYTTSIARPALFRSYLTEQLEHLVRDYPVQVEVGASESEIPYPYVLDGGDLSKVPRDSLYFDDGRHAPASLPIICASCSGVIPSARACATSGRTYVS